MSELKGTRVAIIAMDGFEESELTEPREALEGAGKVKVDRNLVTSRGPKDLPAFSREMLAAFSRVPASVRL